MAFGDQRSLAFGKGRTAEQVHNFYTIEKKRPNFEKIFDHSAATLCYYFTKALAANEGTAKLICP